MSDPNKRAAPSANREAANQTTCGKSSISSADCKRFDPAALEDMRCRLPEFLTKTGVELTQRGARLVGKCPCHDDGNPSFAVFPNGKNCGCFPCGFSGDVFNVSQRMGRAGNFVEAVADVAAVLGVHISSQPAGTATRPATAPQRPAKQPEPPFMLSDTDKAKIHAARLAWCDAFHGGDPIVAKICESLGFSRETLRLASWGECGLGISNKWLCYTYPNGLKWRNPDPQAKPRFRWIVGKALAPWRWEFATRPEVRTLYLTEGESDCLALIAAGLEADGDAVCVASPGTSFSPAWAPMFSGKRVVLCFDLDPPGMTAAAKVAAMLAGHAADILTWRGGRQ